MKNLDEAKRLLGERHGLRNDWAVRLSTAHSILSIAESLEFLVSAYKFPHVSVTPTNDGPVTRGIKFDEPASRKRPVICCGGNPEEWWTCGLCGCKGATAFFSRKLCITHQLDTPD